MLHDHGRFLRIPAAALVFHQHELQPDGVRGPLHDQLELLRPERGLLRARGQHQRGAPDGPLHGRPVPSAPLAHRHGRPGTAEAGTEEAEEQDRGQQVQEEEAGEDRQAGGQSVQPQVREL